MIYLTDEEIKKVYGELPQKEIDNIRSGLLNLARMFVRTPLKELGEIEKGQNAIGNLHTRQFG